MTKIFKLTGTNLSIDDVAFIAQAKLGEVQLEIHPNALDKMKKSRQVILDIVKFIFNLNYSALRIAFSVFINLYI